jgi:hypothetical protein
MNGETIPSLERDVEALRLSDLTKRSVPPMKDTAQTAVPAKPTAPSQDIDHEIVPGRGEAHAPAPARTMGEQRGKVSQKVETPEPGVEGSGVCQVAMPLSSPSAAPGHGNLSIAYLR